MRMLIVVSAVLLMVIILLNLTACGFNGDQKLSQAGSSDTNIKIIFEFINQVEDLCRMQTLRADYETIELYNQAVATCTFAHLSTINLGSVCSTPGLTPEQQSTCQGLNQ